MTRSLFEIRNLKVTYRVGHEFVAALKGISLDIRQEEILALVGESGSGKTSIGLSLGKLLPPSAKVEGSIRYENREILTLEGESLRSYRRHALGFVFQEPAVSLNPVLTIEAQMRECLERADRSTVQKLLTDAQISDAARVAAAYPHELSGGLKQRVMIAMALAKKPKLIVADEPTTALDVTLQKGILKLLIELKKKQALSILFVTHDLNVAFAVADRVLIMKDGGLVEEIDSKSAVVTHEYSKRLMNAFSKPSKPKECFDV